MVIVCGVGTVDIIPVSTDRDDRFLALEDFQKPFFVALRLSAPSLSGNCESPELNGIAL